MNAILFRSKKERQLHLVALVFSCLVWTAVVVTIVGLLYAPFVAAVVVLAHALWLARIMGNGIRVGTRQMPELYRRVLRAADALGLEKVPEVFVISGGGILNAFATKLLSRTFVILNAEAVDACDKVDAGKSPEEPHAIDFLIGHELGHLALGHLSNAWLLWPAKAMPLLGAAYSRAREYSCDACGLHVCGSVETAARALAVITAGGEQGRKVNVEAWQEQRHETGGLVMALVELNSTHPFMSKRVATLSQLRDGGFDHEVSRNPISYVLAPFFNVPLVATAFYAGVLAAIAIPNFLKFQERARLKEQALASAAFLDGPGDSGGAAQQGAATPEPVAAEDAAPPPAAPMQQGTEPAPVHFEALSWLKQQRAAQNPQAVANLATHDALALVQKLTKAGASYVWAANVMVDAQGVYANGLVVGLPTSQAARKKIVDICSAENRKQGREACVDSDSLYLTWEPSAGEMAAP